jgi:hypothetical protein
MGAIVEDELHSISTQPSTLAVDARHPVRIIKINILKISFIISTPLKIV